MTPSELGRTSETIEPPKSEFVRKLEAQWVKGNFVCVGLDSDFSKLPPCLKDRLGIRKESIIAKFNQEIVDATAPFVCAYKPNIAFYEAEGAQGLGALEQTISYIKTKYPDIPVILDAKRADIGSTNTGYVRAAFEYLWADAITVNPYFGEEGLKPFLERKDKGIIVLCRTSNPGAKELQDLKVTFAFKEWYELIGGPTRSNLPSDVFRWKPNFSLYEVVAIRVANHWNKNGNCAVVVGATYPGELQQVRKYVGDLPILIPGIGKQGGTAEQVVPAGQDSRGWGMIINSSRDIIFASGDEDFAQAAGIAAQKLRDEINKYRQT